MSLRALWWACVLALLWIVPVRSASAAVLRYAVVVGNDEGDTDERRLRYAQDDAQKVARVLQNLGRFAPENTTVLLGEDADEVKRVLISINDRIRDETARGNEVVLFVYYSGHADAQALHLRDTRLDVRTLRQLVRGSSAEVRVLMLDACRSGALTRVKGVTPTKRFDVSVDDRLSQEGMVFLTSSTATEDAQESEELKGSFFTHYFVSGLLGAADEDGNRAVTMSEAYGYAYDRTIRASSRTMYGVQHPTFSMQLRGRDDLVLSWLGGERRARVQFPKGRTYLLFADDRDGPVVAEIGRNDVVRELSLQPGRYFVRARLRDALLEGTVRVEPDATTVVEDRGMRRTEYARLARKGGTRRLSHGPQVGAQVVSGLWQGASPCWGVRAGYSIDHRWLTVVPRAGWCRSNNRRAVLPTTLDHYDLDVSMLHAFDLPVITIGLGVVGGVGVLRQRFHTSREAPSNTTIAGHVDVLLALTWDLPRGIYFQTDVALQGHAFSIDDDGRRVERFVPAGRGFLGLGKRF